MIEFTCAHCGITVRCADENAGRKGRCWACGAVVIIPSAVGTAPTVSVNGADSVIPLTSSPKGKDAPPETDDAVDQVMLDEIELPVQVNKTGETDIIPADQIAKRGRGEKPMPWHERLARSRKPAQRRQRRGFPWQIALIVAITLAIATVAVVLITKN